jgi:uncharacterized protein (DUF111 family)
MTIAYLDCFSGISGDMFLGALLDAGLSFDALVGRMKTLPLKGYHLERKQEARNQIFGTQFLVRLDTKDQPHRNLKIIREIIRKADMSDFVKDKSIQIFEALATVEGEIHNRRPDDIQFHEVGAVDSIMEWKKWISHPFLYRPYPWEAVLLRRPMGRCRSRPRQP